ncbi:hypothetical protein BH18ACT5_BH18ACT5_00200 [soil metagenome]
MRSRLGSWLLITLLAVSLAVVVFTMPAAEEDRARAIGSQIRCPVCQGESIIDSPSETARAMMDLVRLRIDEGLSDDAIIAELLRSYGGSLLLDPPASGATLWLWLAPPLALGLGAIMIVRRLRTQPVASAEMVVAPKKLSSAWVWGAVVLILGGAVAVATVGQFQQARPNDESLAGVAGAEFDSDAVSNETLEAVVAANADNPAINGMRLALANRYFEEGNYQQAFGHYQTVLDNEPAPGEAANAFTRLGWMVFDGNGEADLGIDLIDQGLDLLPGDAFAIYLKGRIIWCGKDDPVTASDLFSSVLSSAGLDDDVRARVQADLAAAESGESCP